MKSLKALFRSICLNLAGEKELLYVIETQKQMLCAIADLKRIKVGSAMVHIITNTANKDAEMHITFALPNDTDSHIFADRFHVFVIDKVKEYFENATKSKETSKLP